MNKPINFQAAKGGIDNQEKYWRGLFTPSELFQMPLDVRKKLHSVLVQRCEEIVMTTYAWIDVTDKLKHAKAGREARHKCWELFATKNGGGGNAA